MPDPATEALAEGLPPGMLKSFRALADHSEVPRTTLQHRARGRQSLKEKAQKQQYLYPWEEKALVKFIIQQDEIGRPVRIKYVPSIAFSIACHRPEPDRPFKAPGKNWTQFFCKRHADALKASKSRALDWNRFHIYDKATHWFEVIGKVLQDPAVLLKNVWNMDETGAMLSKPNSVKVLVSRDSKRDYRGARVKRTSITAIECVSAAGGFLDPMIIWPASTHRANWTTHPTPGWHYAYSDKGYTDSYLSLQWLKLVFDPQTRDQANKKPRVLIADGFGTHETLEIMEFCFENNIILCRIPSHTSHKLQPCDVSVFAPLKEAYREQVERLERGCVGTIGKEHFISLYCPAREKALNPRTIRSGWTETGLFPFNPDKVLSDLPKPVAHQTAPLSNVARCGSHTQSQATTPKTPVTPVSAGGVAALHNLIKEDVQVVDESHKQRLQKHVQKLANATQLSFAERALLFEQKEFLAKINNEAKVRRTTKAKIIGTARVMCYEDLEKARAERAAKDAEKEAASNARKAKKAKKESRAMPTAEEATAGRAKRGLKRKIPTEADVAETTATGVQICQTQADEEDISARPWQAPVARMW